MSGILTALQGVVTLGNTQVFRADAYASFLKLAVPFDIVNQADDIAYKISGSGLTTPASKTQGGNATITNTQVLWAGGTDPNYQRSLNHVATGGQDGLLYTLPTAIPATTGGTYVVECWIYANSATTNANWTFSNADFGGGRWLFGFSTNSSTSFGGENNVGLNGATWRHIAIVCDGGTRRFYRNGVHLGAWVGNVSAFSNLYVGYQLNGDPNDFRGHMTDLRVYVGTNKGYTGTSGVSSNFTLPSSIIQTM